MTAGNQCDGPGIGTESGARIAIENASRKAERREYRAYVAEMIARAIEDAMCEPGDQCANRFCPDCVKYGQAKADAAIARRMATR